MKDIERAVIDSAEGSLKRLRRDHIDLFQLHNPIAMQRPPERSWVGVNDLAPVVRAFERLQQQGKIRFWGINGLGDTEALQQVVSSVPAYSVQCCFNLLNPSAGLPAPAGFPHQDYRQLIDAAAAKQMGVIAIRVLAGGALSGSVDRHANAAQSVDPIATSPSFAEDVRWSQQFQFLVQDGYAGSLVEAAIRFVAGKAEVSTLTAARFTQLLARGPLRPSECKSALLHSLVWR
jgi:aryl-alcohol dehydrogenase-like predicted oxidoreductase